MLSKLHVANNYMSISVIFNFKCSFHIISNILAFFKSATLPLLKYLAILHEQLNISQLLPNIFVRANCQNAFIRFDHRYVCRQGNKSSPRLLAVMCLGEFSCHPKALCQVMWITNKCCHIHCTWSRGQARNARCQIKVLVHSFVMRPFHEPPAVSASL